MEIDQHVSPGDLSCLLIMVGFLTWPYVFFRNGLTPPWRGKDTVNLTFLQNLAHCQGPYKGSIMITAIQNAQSRLKVN